MTESQRGTVDASRPPWIPVIVGVRCPACRLGGDIPDTIARTVCPRCGTVFAVAANRAERPAPRAAAPSPPPPAPSAPPDPSAPPAPSATVVHHTAAPPTVLDPIELGPITPDQV